MNTNFLIVPNFHTHFTRFLSMWILIIPLLINAKTHTKSFVINFSENDFVWSINNQGEFEIDSKEEFIYPESDEPGLPLISKDIAIDANYSFKSVTLSFEKRLVLSDIHLAPAPMLSCTEIIESKNAEVIRHTYDHTKQFPLSNCTYVSTSNWGSIGVMHFLTSPFIYDAGDQKVYFIDSMRLDIELEDNIPIFRKPLDRINVSKLKKSVVNAEMIDGLEVSSITDIQSIELEDRMDYVVITSQELASSFKPLCQWKTEKGLFAKIITMEDIKSNYSGKDTQLKIKQCLHDLYQNHGLKYVLLGGDDGIVPVRGCYGAVTTDKGLAQDLTIPTDMYYACFDGCFDWDDDGNGIYGEPSDNINLKQNIFLTRLPVHTSEHVNAFTLKLLEYERNPTFNNNILMCGNNLLNSGTDNQSDAELQGDKEYQKYIQQYWSGTRHKFYDTHTDFEGDGEYEITAFNLSNKFEDGYAFMNMITHGSQTSWCLELRKDYDETFGSKQKNNSQTIVSTTACYTNAFDFSNKGSKDPCLSESLIRNPNSGVVAYLGCSRQGFGYEGNKLGTSMEYDGSFYKNLFSNTIEELNFGVVVEAVKAARIASCNRNNSWRWIQFGLNPIGDPEMPIWISEPKLFKNIKFSVTGSCININAAENGCRICIVDEWDHGEGYFNVLKDVSLASLSNIPEESSVCITKPGYIPKQIKLSIIQNEVVSNNRSYRNDVLLCGSSITSNKKAGDFVIKAGKTTMNADIVILAPGTKVEKGAQLVINYK